MDTNYDESFWLDFARQVQSLLEIERRKLSYNFNILDELHLGVNENAHTRILLKLLSYHKGGQYPYLRSFLNMMDRHVQDVGFPMDKVMSPRIEFNAEYIDGLIEEPSKSYAVIIENKINWAIDQNRQIERYYNTVRGHGINDGDIYVIYLTEDGNKKPDERSVPAWLFSSLGSRFVELNYRNDILPWLEDELLPEVTIGERLVESGIRQYADYLRGRFSLRTSEEPIRRIMSEAINERLGLDGKSEVDKWLLLNKSANDVSELLTGLQTEKERVTAVVGRDWDEMTREHFGATNDQLRQGYYQIFMDGVDRSIHFEWMPYGEKMLFDNPHGTYRMALHVENDRDGRWMSLLYRNALFGRLARSLGYNLTFSGVDAICKEYTTPSARPFAALGSEERRSFLASVYSEVKELKACVERTIHKFDGEQDIIVNLCKEMTALTGQEWWWWPKNPQSAWDIGTKFNPNTHEIGIEGGFNIRESDAMLVFNSYITVWDSRQWGIYEDKLNAEFPGMHVDKSAEGGRRVYLHLPEVVIGEDLGMWDERKHDVVAGLSDTFSRMKRITSEVGL